MSEPQFQFPLAELQTFCQRWGIARLELFGSLARGSFNDKSDVDLLVTFDVGVIRSLFDFVDMTEELEKTFGRPIDLVSRKAIEQSRNPYRKEEILGSAKVIYVKAA